MCLPSCYVLHNRTRATCPAAWQDSTCKIGNCFCHVSSDNNYKNTHTHTLTFSDKRAGQEAGGGVLEVNTCTETRLKTF